jgi:large subunit ribosomal protein L33
MNNIIMAKKGNRIQVILECTEQKNSDVPGMSRYITTKNKKNTTERIELKKYNPFMKKVTVHKEIK